MKTFDAGVRMLKKILGICDKVLTFVEEWTLFVTVIVALLALFVNVVLRYGFNYSLAWSEELVRHVIVFTTFIGCSAAVKNRSTIKIDALVEESEIKLQRFSHLSETDRQAIVEAVFALLVPKEPEAEE